MRRVLAVDSFVVWAISIVLAGVFLLAGMPKLLGMPSIALQAAAMDGFPGWIRVLAGIVQSVGGIALLIPAIATPAALLLAATMIPAAITQYVSGEPGTFIPVLVLALLLYVAWRRNAKRMSDGYHEFAAAPHPLLYEGVLAGVIGATAIAVWFFVLDAISGRMFFTPITLGRGLVGVIAPGVDYGPTASVLVYTVFHYAAFMFVGLAASLVVFLARKEPSILFAFILLFAVAEVGIYVLVSILDVATPLGRFAWLQIMAGNVIAAGAMGWFFWHRHRELGEEFRHSLDWEAPDPADVAPAPVIPPNPIARMRDGVDRAPAGTRPAG